MLVQVFVFSATGTVQRLQGGVVCGHVGGAAGPQVEPVESRLETCRR